jgi:hypothetical protein
MVRVLLSFLAALEHRPASTPPSRARHRTSLCPETSIHLALSHTPYTAKVIHNFYSFFPP